MKRRLTKTDSLRTLVEAGLQVSSVFDIGVQRDTPELRAFFPDKPHILFDPVAEYTDDIARNYSGIDYRLENIAVSDRDGPMWLKEFRKDGDGTVSHVHPALFYEEGLRTVSTRSLDSYMRDAYARDQNLAPYLVKIDVDGHETEILRGAKNTLASTSCLIVETTLPHLSERCMLAEKAGLVLWDVVDLSYFHGCLYQMDLVFIMPKFMARPGSVDPNAMMGEVNIDPSAWYGHHASDSEE